MRGLPFPPFPPFPWLFDCACCTFLRPSSLSSTFSFHAPAILVRGGIGLLLADASGERDAAGSSGSNCGGGAGNGPGVSCARTSPGAARLAAPSMQIKLATIVILFLIVILTRTLTPPKRCMPSLSVPSRSTRRALRAVSTRINLIVPVSAHPTACARSILSYFSMRESTRKMSTLSSVPKCSNLPRECSTPHFFSASTVVRLSNPVYTRSLHRPWSSSVVSHLSPRSRSASTQSDRSDACNAAKHASRNTPAARSRRTAPPETHTHFAHATEPQFQSRCRSPSRSSTQRSLESRLNRPSQNPPPDETTQSKKT